MTVWKVFCKDREYPGLWRTWFLNQTVAVGWAPQLGFKLTGESEREEGWGKIRGKLQEIKVGDKILVHLPGRRIGRVGDICGLKIEDGDWDPLIKARQSEQYGEFGRRILVRWDLSIGSTNPDSVFELPPDIVLPPNISRPTLVKIPEHLYDHILEAMKELSNWRLPYRFRYERSLSDYIANFPHKLEDGMRPYPSKRVREAVFPDNTRSDVLLIDKEDKLVIVECKQYAPIKEDLRQLRGYMRNAIEKLREKQVRGILVHGGSRKLSADVQKEFLKDPKVEIVQYELSMNFNNCN